MPLVGGGQKAHSTRQMQKLQINCCRQDPGSPHTLFGVLTVTLSRCLHIFSRLTLALLVVAALGASLVILTSQSTRALTPLDAPFTVQINPLAAEVEAGGTFNAHYRLNYTGVEQPVNVELMIPIPDGISAVQARMVDGESGGVQTVGTRKTSGYFRWRGRMQQGGQLTLELRMKTFVCSDPDNGDIILEASARLAGAEETATASGHDPVKVLCLQAVTEDDVSITKRIIAVGENTGDDLGVNADAGNNETVGLQIDVTNHLNKSIVALIADQMAAQEQGIQCAWKPRSVRFSGDEISAIPPNALKDPPMEDAVYFLALDIEPGETETIEIIGAGKSGEIDCMLHGSGTIWGMETAAINNDATQTAAGTENNVETISMQPQVRLVKMLAGLPAIHSNEVTLTVVAPDLGDAPDSSNHFGAGMSAYPAVPADFPTVFDPAAGAPPGPRHRVAQPLHLGQQVSREKDADLNPNRNLNPPANQNNLDTHDDGVNAAALNFAACQTSKITVRVAIGQAAVAHFEETGGTAYLNVWVDGNRDGDWADTMNCGQDVGAGLEHIVIDKQVDVKALGKGMHNISITTLPVLWPQPKKHHPAWLRVTLSNQPAPKGLNAGSISYGNGRGPSGGYLLGETEDYLLTWQDTPNELLVGADMAVGNEITVEEDAETVELSAQKRINWETLKMDVRYRNNGDRSATNARVQIFTTPYLGVPAATEDSHDWTWCLTCTLASNIQAMHTAPAAVLPMHEVCDNQGNCHLEIDMMEVPVGKGGNKILGWHWLPEIGDEVLVTTRVVSDEDANDADDSVKRKVERPVRPIRITYPGNVTLGAPTGQTAADSAPMDSITTWVRGRAEPGSTLHIFTDGFESGDISVTDDGQWQTQITLPEGAQNIWADYMHSEEAVEAVLAVTAPSLDGLLEPEISATYCLTCIDYRIRLNVNPALPWNPASLTIRRLDASTLHAADDLPKSLTNNEFRPIDALGRTDAEGWVLPLRPNADYEISVEASCGGETEVNLVWDDTDIVHLIDPDKDGVFTGNFKGTDEELQATIEVTCGTDQRAYIGETEKNVSAPTVVDARTGLPIAGAEVTLWQGYVVTPDLQKWQLWPDDDLDPQLTAADGSFSFFLPEAGRYRLSVTKDGYQPYRSPALSLLGVFPNRSIKLIPAVGAANQVVNISEDGFDTPTVLVEPGNVVHFRNMALTEHTATGITTTSMSNQALGTGNSFDSGALTGGESVSFRFDEAGAYTFTDSENPMHKMVIIVEPLNNHLFLPIIDSD